MKMELESDIIRF